MILHVDMDAFYASVEERDRPELVGKPLIVGGTPQGRGVVAAANYVVRQFGVHSAMPTATALRLCPQAVVVRPRLGHYADISAEIREIFERYTPLVEPLSLDEAFLDVSGVEGLFGPAPEIARKIKQEIFQKLRLVASVGVAPNKFLAKIASALKKPDALVVVRPDEVQGFLDPLPIDKLWGVGRVTAQAFERLGIRTVRDVRELSEEFLSRHFGSWGEHFWKLARGIDDRSVIPERDARSISHETTFAVDIDDAEVLRAWLLQLTEEVAARLRRHRLRGRTVQLKIRRNDFRTFTRAHTWPHTTDSTQEIWQAARELLGDFQSTHPTPVRLLGVGMSGLESDRQRQLDLFPDEEHARDVRLDAVRDSIQDRFGSGALQRGSVIQRGEERENRKPPPPGR